MTFDMWVNYFSIFGVQTIIGLLVAGILIHLHKSKKNS